MSDDFDPERARDLTLSSILHTAETIAANAERLAPLVQSRLGAPSTEAAFASINMCMHLLKIVHGLVAQADSSTLYDAQSKPANPDIKH